MAQDEQEPGEQRETYRGYTYRRRRVRRETGNWKDGEPSSGRAKEEIVEETVTSPEEVPEPFPEEVKQPDIIVFEQVAGQVRFAHEVYREEETERWRIEPLRTNPAIVDDPGPGGLPQALEIPPEERFEALDEPPTDPRFVLELCLNPSAVQPGRGGARVGVLALPGRGGGPARRGGPGMGIGVGVVRRRIHCGLRELVRTDREERMRDPEVCGGRGIRARAVFRGCGLGYVFRDWDLYALRAPGTRGRDSVLRPLLASWTDEPGHVHGSVAEVWVAP